MVIFATRFTGSAGFDLASADFREVAQPGSALRSGRRGRRFESCLPDKESKAIRQEAR